MKKQRKSVFGFFVLFLGLNCLCNLALAGSAVDPLAESIKPQIQALFGAGSTVAYAIYIAEIVLGSVAYIKTKNILLFAGVPLLMLFTSGMFNYIGA